MNPHACPSFRSAVNLELAEFVGKVERHYDEHQIQFELNRGQTFDAILSFILPNSGHESINNQTLSNFLQSTLNNQTEKKLKRKYCTKEITQVSGSTKLFGCSDQAFINQSFMRDSSMNHKSSLFSSFIPYQKYIKTTNPLFEFDPSKEQQISEILSQRFDQESSYLSKSSFETKKQYKLYSQTQKSEIITFASKFGVREACKKYRISSAKIGIWEKSFSKVKQARGRKPIDPEMQKKVCGWLQSQLDQGSILTQKIICEKAKKISCSGQFKASKGWLQKFFKRRPQLFKAYSENRKIGKNNELNKESAMVAKMQRSPCADQFSSQKIKKER